MENKCILVLNDSNEKEILKIIIQQHNLNSIFTQGYILYNSNYFIKHNISSGLMNVTKTNHYGYSSGDLITVINFIQVSEKIAKSNSEKINDNIYTSNNQNNITGLTKLLDEFKQHNNITSKIQENDLSIARQELRKFLYSKNRL